MPEERKSVFLIKNPEDDIEKADVGYLVINEEGLKGFFIDDDFKVLKLGSRYAWMYVEEKVFFVPKVEDDQLECAYRH